MRRLGAGGYNRSCPKNRGIQVHQKRTKAFQAEQRPGCTQCRLGFGHMIDTSFDATSLGYKPSHLWWSH